MLEQKQKDVLTLIRSAVNEEILSISDNFDEDYICKIAQRHQIFGLIFYGLDNCGLKKSKMYQELFLKTCKSISVSQRQLRELDVIYALFEKEKIDYMPLKGALLKALYPKPEMRLMGDADILIRIKDYDKIKKLLLLIDFVEKGESDHELTWCKPELYLELHKRIVPKRDKAYSGYFGDGWKFAQKCNDSEYRYQMSKEMTFVFLFTHFVKHYMGAGIGIKHMVDLWAYKRANPNMNDIIVLQELDKLKLSVFYENIMHTLKAWFGQTEFNEKDEYITNIIFNNGVFGNNENALLSKSKTKKGNAAKIKELFFVVFLPYSSMKYAYPVLKKAPVLLPLFWVVRAFNSLFIKKKKIGAELQEIKELSDKKIDEYTEALAYVGLGDIK